MTAGVQDEDEDFFAEMEGRKDSGRPRPAERECRDDDGDRRDGKKRRRRGMLEDLSDFDF